MLLKIRIKRARDKLSLSQQEFGKLLGITGKHARDKVNSWEIGKTEPNKTAQLIIEYILSLYNPKNDSFLEFLQNFKEVEDDSFKNNT